MKTKNLKQIGFSVLGISTLFALTLIVGANHADAAITSQLQVGSRGAQVSELQQFLATNSKIYPSGMVTGYFGGLTQAAVVQFQANYDISQVGRVGPATMARINQVMSSGLGLDISAPVLSGINVSLTNTTANVSWSTDSQAGGKVIYSSQPLQGSDSEISFAAPSVNGTTAQSNSTGFSQNIQLTNLQPNTTYYYIVEATDASGNVSATWPPSTFHTNQ